MAYDAAISLDAEPRHDWTLEEVEALFELPFTELLFRAATVHRRWFDPSEVQISQLLSMSWPYEIEEDSSRQFTDRNIRK